MIPRKRLDIGWSDLLFGLGRCLAPYDAESAAQRVEQVWSPERTVACLSVRSGFDALLSVLDLPRGSEVLVSAVTIRDMTRILEAHGLVPVPVDIDIESLSVSVESLEAAVTPRTKAVLIAHLFGSRMPLERVAKFAQSHGLIFVEDCAQAFTGDAYRGHPDADVSLFSFGPIKTATALGGGLLRFRSTELAVRVRHHMRSWPVQSRGAFLVRLARFGLLNALSARWAYTAIMAGCRLVGVNHDEFVGRSARGFPGGDLLAKIRRRPSSPLLALIRRRITNYARPSISERIRLARLATDLLPCEMPGSEAAEHSYWVFPILHDQPDLLMRHLAAHGFDATRGASSLYVVEPPADRPENRAQKAEAAFDRLLYLPVYPGVSPSEIARLADAMQSFQRKSATTGAVTRPAVSVRPAAVKI